MKRVILTPDISSAATVQGLEPEAPVFGCYDSFVTGPLRDPLTELEAFGEARKAYWGDVYGEPDGGKEWRLWNAEYESIGEWTKDADRVEVWAGSGVLDTAFALFAPLYLAATEVPVARIFIRQATGSTADWLAMYNEGALAAFKDTTPLRPVDIDGCAAIWSRLCTLEEGGEPETAGQARLLSVLRGRQPDADTGLTNIQRYLLVDAPPERRKAAYFIGNAMGAAMDAQDYVGDWVLFHEFLKLSDASHGPALFDLFGDGPGMRDYEARLTEAGQAMKDRLS